MINMNNFKKFWLQFGFLIATVITLFVNGLATFGNLGGLSTKEISDKFFTILTPAGFTFSIWSIIYLGLLIVGVGIALKKIQTTFKTLTYYAGSSFANCTWIFLWQFINPALSTFMLFVLVYFNAKTYLELKKSNTENNPKNNQIRTSVTSLYLIYLGWSIVASLINIIVLFKYVLGFNGFGINEGHWGLGLIISALVINIFISIRELNPTAAIVLFWALIGIKSAQANVILINGINVIMVLLVLLAAQTFREYKKAKENLSSVI